MRSPTMDAGNGTSLYPRQREGASPKRTRAVRKSKTEPRSRLVRVKRGWSEKNEEDLVEWCGLAGSEHGGTRVSG